MRYKVPDSADGKLLSEFLTSVNISAKLQRKIKRLPNKVTRDGSLIKSNEKVYVGDEIEIYIEDKNEIKPNGELYAKILYEDDDAIVFDKPAGMPTIPSHGHYEDTLGNYFTYLYPKTTYRPVNRLDRNTSGCVLIAKNQHSASMLQKNFDKTYYAAVEGKTEPTGTIDLPIARAEDTLILRCVDPNGKRAVTKYRTILSNNEISYVEIKLLTGRTHQIRVHFSAIGHPLLGDDLYGGKTDKITRQALHCGKISFVTPSGKKVEVISCLPKDIENLLK